MDTLMYGRSRKDRIRILLRYHKYLTASLIAAAEFRSPAGGRKCQDVLLRMIEDREIKRFRSGREYVYHVDNRPSKKWRHWLMINYFHFYFVERLRLWQQLVRYQFEYPYGFGQADGLYFINNTRDQKLSKFFLEIDLDSGDPFDKVEKYTAAFTDPNWREQEWGGDTFPSIVVVSARPEQVKRIISRDNRVLKFKVIPLEEVVK